MAEVEAQIYSKIMDGDVPYSIIIKLGPCLSTGFVVKDAGEILCNLSVEELQAGDEVIIVVDDNQKVLAVRKAE